MDERALLRQMLAAQQAVDTPQTFAMSGREWDVLPGVYAPMFTRAAEFFAGALPYPRGGAFLEIGSGTGVIAVTAALSGCARVTATDISPEAAANTAMNARRHGADAVTTVCGDMFAPLADGDRYDLVFWNSSSLPTSQAWPETEGLGRAITDPGYRFHDAYLAGAADHLTPDGRLMLGFSNVGDRAHLDRLADRHGWTIRALDRGEVVFPGRSGSFDLLELTRRTPAG
ncbi:methyltransferase domain-containing protein [Yinghuangia seranimata]|uniref:methyltransferase domain-containing protein n=1 Tax=Yinghuangia seranimata TaxID=408067 RepID=UPI00248BF44B|nr:methyltransferase domain-containing protein [Yinghuangia seranimata]MDI2125700.1 methyltransferase domain-containing protein [Yinghuangia seranimata]